jgi:hypothetical protein
VSASIEKEFGVAVPITANWESIYLTSQIGKLDTLKKIIEFVAVRLAPAIREYNFISSFFFFFLFSYFFKFSSALFELKGKYPKGGIQKLKVIEQKSFK